jgi:hypothetical protein
LNEVAPSLSALTFDRFKEGVRMKKSILFFCAAIVAFVTSINAQTSNDLRRVFGKPATEVYRLGSDITVTVNYDAQAQVCDIQLAGDYLSARKAADKLVPVKSRGRQLSPPVSLIPAMDCCESWAYEYEKLTMITFMGTGQPTIRYVFKGRACVVKQPLIQRPSQFSPGVITPTRSTSRGDLNAGNANKVYRKYETTQPADILELPAPELTPEAIGNPELGEMIIEAILAPSGEVRNIVQRGNLKNGMTDKAIVAARKIKFKPALLDGKLVPQLIYIKYSVQKCDGGTICTSAVEILDFK